MHHYEFLSEEMTEAFDEIEEAVGLTDAGFLKNERIDMPWF